MLPQYQFEKLLGRGGMGAVYKALQVSLDRPVAIKVLPSDLIDNADANFLERFKNEARTMAKLNHPSIVNVYDFGETRTGLLYFVMEFIDGTDVLQMIASQGRLPEEYALSITAHVCDALAYAHKNGVIHRDIKPANILINMEGAVKVADFGLAKANDPNQSGITKTNMAMGTPDFVAPEAFVPGVPLDGRADLYAIGVMLYQMLAGEIPRGIWTMPGMKVGTDPRFDVIIGKAMQTDREARYQTAADLRRDLDTILTLPRAVLVAQQQAAAEVAARATRAQEARTSESGEPERKAADTPKKNGTGMVVAAVAAIVAVVAGGMIFTGGKNKATAPAPAKTASAPEDPVKATDNKTAAVSSPPRKPSKVKEGEIILFEGHRYQFLSGPFLKNEAPEMAARMGGHLVSVNSAREQAWLEENFASLIAGKNHGWCRTSGKMSQDKSWQWSDDDVVAYTNWAPGYPDGKASTEILTLQEQDGRLLWKTTYWSNPVSMVIEWDDDGSTQERKSSPPPPVPQPPPAGIALRPQPVEAGWADLITGIEVGRDSLMVPWTKENGVLLSPQEPHSVDSPQGHTTVRLPMRDPSRNYDLRFRIERLKPGHTVAIAFARGDEPLCLLVDGGLGFMLRNNTSGHTERRWLPVGESHDILFEAREKHLRVLLDDQALIDLDGPLKEGQSEGYFFPSSKVSGPIFAVGVCGGRIAVLQAAYRNVEVKPAPPPPATALGDPVIAKLDASFRARLAADAKSGLDAGLTRLNASYVTSGIAKARAAAQARGSLKEVTALEEEKRRIEARQSVPENDDEGTPGVLVKLRKTYRAALGKLRAESDAKARPLYKIYLTAIKARIAELTRANDLPMAKALQDFHDEIAKQEPAESGAAAPAPPLATTATPPRPESNNVATSRGGSSWRAAAEYLVNNGGTFVAFKNGATTAAISKSEDIPSGRFDIIELTFDRFNSVLPPAKDADFAAFSGLRDLIRVHIRPMQSGLTDSAFAFLAGSSELTNLNLEGVGGLTDGVLAHIAGLRKLDYLAIQHAENFTGQGLDKIAGVNSITNLELLGSGITDEGMKAIATFKKLQALRVISPKVTSAGFAALAGLKTLVSLNVSGTGFDDEAAGIVAGISGLANLDLGATKITDAGLQKLRPLKKLASLNLAGTAVTAEAAAAFQKNMPQCRVSR